MTYSGFLQHILAIRNNAVINIHVQVLVRTRVFISLECVRLFGTLWTVAQQAPLSMGFSRQGYWSGLPCPPPGNLPDPGIEPVSLALQADSLPTEPPGKPIMECINVNFLVLIMYCSYARGNHWRKQGQGYTGSFCTFLFATSCKSIIISKKIQMFKSHLGT